MRHCQGIIYSLCDQHQHKHQDQAMLYSFNCNEKHLAHGHEVLSSASSLRDVESVGPHDSAQ